ncbi:hypothetical protein CYMTET_39660 [Cymbomonas tetramitiformis]|uniref:Uncharacterized protein n=1 Tax=Cymbomonas tetramitiformis TaxID=36881 RepID=A0AAE0CAQ1_9CHLO|nr:hypothetical protein CYMTET_39660 [Cymbomonas tetramitiformis]
MARAAAIDVFTVTFIFTSFIRESSLVILASFSTVSSLNFLLMRTPKQPSKLSWYTKRRQEMAFAVLLEASTMKVVQRKVICFMQVLNSTALCNKLSVCLRYGWQYAKNSIENMATTVE